jgi:hypothetical protein
MNVASVQETRKDIVQEFGYPEIYVMIWNNLVNIVTSLWAGYSGFDSQRAGFFSLPQCPDLLWDPPSHRRVLSGLEAECLPSSYSGIKSV